MRIIFSSLKHILQLLLVTSFDFTKFLIDLGSLIIDVGLIWGQSMSIWGQSMSIQNRLRVGQP